MNFEIGICFVFRYSDFVLQRYLELLLTRTTASRTIDSILDDAATGQRISVEDALLLAEKASLADLGMGANQRRQSLHPGKRVSYIVERNINYTNVCNVYCRFCAFYRGPGRPGGYTLSKQQLAQKIEETVEAGGIQVLLQGGLNPDLGIEHLNQLRQLQDETGGFTAFITWPYQQGSLSLRRGNTTAPEYLRVQALSRLFLDNVPHLQSSWVTQGPSVGQIALDFGADDFGAVMFKENVVSAAGTTFRMNADSIEQQIRSAGYTPWRRDVRYQESSARILPSK